MLRIQRCINNIANRYPAIPKISEDGKFGGGTMSAVIAFQQLYGLTADGVVGPATWAKIMSECSSSAGTPPAYPGYLISVGSSGEYVRDIQTCLNRLSVKYTVIPSVTADGVFGSATKNAVIAFQRAFGLTQDGIIGAATWNKLMQECGVAAVPVTTARTDNAGGGAALENETVPVMRMMDYGAMVRKNGCGCGDETPPATGMDADRKTTAGEDVNNGGKAVWPQEPLDPGMLIKMLLMLLLIRNMNENTSSCGYYSNSV